MNDKVNENAIILAGIIQMQGYFNLIDLYIKFEKMGIKNRVMIKKILDELCESGHIEYSEIENDVWAFEVVDL